MLALQRGCVGVEGDRLHVKVVAVRMRKSQSNKAANLLRGVRCR